MTEAEAAPGLVESPAAEDDCPFEEDDAEDYRDVDIDFVSYGMNMHKIMRGLYISDFQASQQFPVLEELGITTIIAAMKQKYEAPENFKLFRVLVEDSNRTNLMAYFEQTNEIIHDALSNEESVLVHCQAGISRSATICAAFLMHEFGLTVDEAIERISAIRSQVEPTEFFLTQLEMYERMNYEVDPAKSSEYRRFLFNFNHVEMMDGEGGVNQLFLAYYPSPAPTPRDRSGSDPFRELRMTPVEGTSPYSLSRRGSNASITSNASRLSRRSSSNVSVQRKPSIAGLTMTSTQSDEGYSSAQRGRRRINSELGMTSIEPMTSTSSLVTDRSSMNASPSPINQTSTTPGAGNANLRENIKRMLSKHSEDLKSRSAEEKQAEKKKKQLEQLKTETQLMIEGKKKLLAVGQGRVVVTGRRLRCKLCRRELAAREHIVEHHVGEGQAAFAPRRRDMAQHRKDMQKRKQDADQSKAQPPSLQPLEIHNQTKETDGESDKATTDKPVLKVDTGTNKASNPFAIVGRPNPLKPPIFARRGTAEAMLLGLDKNPTASSMAKTDSADCAVAEDDDNEVVIKAGQPSPPLLASSTCSSYFTEPLSWMSAQLSEGQLQGKIACPNKKCGSKLGSFDWAGLQCSCGAWVVPAFMLNASKVDEVSL